MAEGKREMSMNTPNALMAAQAVTFFKGQETQSRENKEKEEQARSLARQLHQAQQELQQKTAQGAQQGGGFLA